MHNELASSRRRQLSRRQKRDEALRSPRKPPHHPGEFCTVSDATCGRKTPRDSAIPAAQKAGDGIAGLDGKESAPCARNRPAQGPQQNAWL
jgi:hypothetical protein